MFAYAISLDWMVGNIWLGREWEHITKVRGGEGVPDNSELKIPYKMSEYNTSLKLQQKGTKANSLFDGHII